MSDTVIVALIAGLPGTLAALASFVNMFRGLRIEEHVLETKVAVKEVEKQTNSMKDALVQAVAEGEFAKGKLEGSSGIK